MLKTPLFEAVKRKYSENIKTPSHARVNNQVPFFNWQSTLLHHHAVNCQSNDIVETLFNQLMLKML